MSRADSIVGERRQKDTSGVARFRVLVRRAQFDARLAAGVARHESLGDDLIVSLRSVYRELNACLKKLEGRKDTQT
jgi:hypothetical protein